MPKTLAKLFILLLALPAFAVAADCTKPDAPSDLPDGASAGKDAMIEGQQTVQAYVKKGDEYVACMDEEAKQFAAEVKALESNENVDEEVLKERQARLQEIVDDRNDVVKEMKDVADAFNAEIDEFQSRGSDGS